MATPVFAFPRRLTGLRRFAFAFFLPTLLLLAQGCSGSLGDPPEGDPPEGDPPSSAVAGVGGGGGGGEPVGSAGGAGGAGSGGAGGGAGSEGPGANWQPVVTDWCGDGWVGLDEHTCFFVPAKLAPTASILFALHGMIPPDSVPKSFESIAREAAEKYGFIAVVPRGARVSARGATR